MPPTRPDLLLRSLPELTLCYLVRDGDQDAFGEILRRYEGFIRLKTSNYFLAGGDPQDLMQEGTIGFYDACCDFRPDRDMSFRNFAELCITRRTISAMRAAARRKHGPLNTSVRLEYDEGEVESGEVRVHAPMMAFAAPSVSEPLSQVIASEELHALVGYLSCALSDLEGSVLALYLDGCPYEEIATRLDCSFKAVDNALQRVKRKVATHLKRRERMSCAACPSEV